ncbi:hypothetical protein GCM10022631_22390 [Deinococcus rubellus]|uniref:Lipoprotein n=1 Tax=Deinococcus rubellus TaxID=1889240 RepID=A0ABY5YIU5_9DEIO|nr:hypothetical protein [Deinococcus rubellus]UWX64267.1 hypothetical protein N0D28_00895 [Deinococcus rubellus]
MKIWTLLGLAALTLTGCQGGPTTQTVMLNVTKVALPPSVGAVEDLPITITVTVGGCQTFKGFAVQKRTASTLKLLTQGTSPTGNVACPAIIGYANETYTDPGNPPRSDLFEVIVNGQSYGTVHIE